MMRPFESGVCSVAIWSGDPTLEDCELAIASARALHDRIGGRVILIGVLKPDVRMPSREVHLRMAECWPQLFALASLIQCVSLPGGMTAARIIAMIGSVFSRHGQTVSIYRTLPAAMQELQQAAPGLSTVEFERLIREAIK